MLEPLDLAIIIASVPAQTAVSDALFRARDEQSRTQALASASLPQHAVSMRSSLPDYCFGRCDGHHEMVDCKKLRLKTRTPPERECRRIVPIDGPMASSFMNLSHQEFISNRSVDTTRPSGHGSWLMWSLSVLGVMKNERGGDFVSA